MSGISLNHMRALNKCHKSVPIDISKTIIVPSFVGCTLKDVNNHIHLEILRKSLIN